MARLLKRIQRVRPAAFCSRDFFLLHDNAPAHKVASFCQFLTPSKKVTTLYNHPYFPDVSPPGYFLFPKLKTKLKGLHFADVAEIQEAVTAELTLRRLMSYIYMEHPFLMFLDHTQRRSTVGRTPLDE